MIQLTEEECRAVYRLIDELSGGNADNAFNWEGHDSPNEPHDRALAKIFHAAGKAIPSQLEGVVE